jgi:phage gp36-like protein
MAYSDKTYFLTKFPTEELDKLTGGGVTGDSNLVEAVKAADSLIDGYLSSALVSVPVAAPVPEMIKQLSYDIAMYNLYDRLDLQDVPDRIQKKYDAAIETLKDIAKKLITIPGQETEDKDQSIKYDTEAPNLDRGSW